MIIWNPINKLKPRSLRFFTLTAYSTNSLRMKLKLILFSILFALHLQSFCQNKKICITIDDLPVVAYGINDTDFQMNITNKLIRTFEEYNIPAIGYVNERKLYDEDRLNSARLDLLVQWVSNGYELGNHTFSHPSYNNVSDTAYFANIKNGEQHIRPLMADYGMELRYFRHPFLHAGPDSVKYFLLENFLQENGYTAAPVTIDNDDYIFAKAYHNAYVEKDTELMESIGAEYVKYMEQKLHFFEQRSEDVFGRNINHTLLIHASFLNAEYLDDLAAMYRKNGYEFISQEEALADEAYSSPMKFFTPYGISWIFRWGLSKGMENKALRGGDIEVPDMVMEIFNR